MQKLGITILCVLYFSCNNNSEVSFRERLQPVPRESGFKMDGYWVWGGSLIRVDNTYHLFASRWPKDNDFPDNYRNHSEIVWATSDDPLGPYQFQNVVIGERDSIYWDSNMAHNPTVHKIDGQYVLFYIGSDFTTYREGSNYLLRKVGYAVAPSINGPWRRSDKSIIDVESNNPAVLVEDDKIALLYRDALLRVFLAEANNFRGPYQIINDNVWPEHKIEDFYLFKMNNAYHFICEDNVGGISGHERWGVHLYSDNGIDNWKKYDPVIVYDHNLHFTDGSVLNCIRRERPQLLIQDGEITHLLTSVYDGENSWCQPVALEPPLATHSRELSEK
jgi:hypothetical protein